MVGILGIGCIYTGMGYVYEYVCEYTYIYYIYTTYVVYSYEVVIGRKEVVIHSFCLLYVVFVNSKL